MRASRPVTQSGGSVLKAPVSIVVGAPQRGHTPSSGGGHAERGLRPQGAQRRRGGTPPRSVNAKLHKGEAAQEPLPMHPAHQIQKSPYPPHYGEDTGIIRSIWAI